MTTGLDDTLTQLQDRLPFCWSISIGDVESDPCFRAACTASKRRPFLIHFSDLMAQQLREQSRLLLEYAATEPVAAAQGAMGAMRYAAYPLDGTGLSGLFVLLLWDDHTGNPALVGAHVRNVLPGVSLSDTDKSCLQRLRKAAWQDGTSGLLTHLRKMPSRPMEIDMPDEDEDEPLPFEHHESVMRLLGVEAGSE